jgi:hypothetical protein
MMVTRANAMAKAQVLDERVQKLLWADFSGLTTGLAAGTGGATGGLRPARPHVRRAHETDWAPDIDALVARIAAAELLHRVAADAGRRRGLSELPGPGTAT